MALMLRPLRHPKSLHEEEQSSLAVKLRLTPTATERTILGPDSMVKKFSDGIIYFTTLGEREANLRSFYQTLLRTSCKRVASSTSPTALDSQMNDDDTEPIEWGDMDPACARMLQTTPSMLQAFKIAQSPKKLAGYPYRRISPPSPQRFLPGVDHN